MKRVNTHEAKTQLSRILSEVEQGEEYIVARSGKPIARLVPYVESAPMPEPGKWRNRVTIRDDFDEDDPALVEQFEQSEL
jgi:prevent-host-death family protein